MKLTVKQLRRLIQEVAMSPSLKQNEQLKDPLKHKGVAKAFGLMRDELNNAIQLAMVVSSMDKYYDESTRQFDDAAYEHIKERAKEAANSASAGAAREIQIAFSNALKGD
jgi:uncharacterized protein (UPF0332 family)